MKQSNEEVIKYRIERAYECLEEAKIMAETKHWNTVVNRLYYACFYMVGALIIKNDMFTSLQDDIKTKFDMYIKSGKIDENFGRLFTELHDKGQEEEDYRNFKTYTKEEIEPLITQTSDLIEKLNLEIKRKH